ncbi:hypothetical protein EBME_0445 [bacterium endosymbiont of Mortierella elongata FMR23-6]|nr:hypothetical protein EBME_0445 [bacterium endosymbiont of Mortierella elongata FMR23-6]
MADSGVSEAVLRILVLISKFSRELVQPYVHLSFVRRPLLMLDGERLARLANG